jgi:adenylate kinase family enzyme
MFPQPTHLTERRIVIIGSTGSGKTTLANRLACTLNLSHVELDALYWGPNWADTPEDEFRRRVREALSGSRWVIDGNYGQVRDITWGRATDLIWLDYSLMLIWSRLFRRALQRILQKEELWNGNRESWRGQFFSRDSLFLYAYTSRKRHHQTYPVLFSQPKYAHLQVEHFRSPEETASWLKMIAA